MSPAGALDMVVVGLWDYGRMRSRSRERGVNVSRQVYSGGKRAWARYWQPDRREGYDNLRSIIMAVHGDHSPESKA
jgi:hypothetical protein